MPCRWVNLARHNTQASQKSRDDDCTLYGSRTLAAQERYFRVPKQSTQWHLVGELHRMHHSASTSIYIWILQPASCWVYIILFNVYACCRQDYIYYYPVAMATPAIDDWPDNTSSNVASAMVTATLILMTTAWHSQGSFRCLPLLFGDALQPQPPFYQSHSHILIGGMH